MAEQQTQTRRAGWSGSTKQTLSSGCMLGAKWWKAGDKLACIFQREFETKFGTGYEFMLVKPATINVFVDEYGTTYKQQPADDAKGEMRQATRFALPSLAGFDMAYQDMQANGFPGFRFGDRVLIECTEIQEAKDFGFSDMPMFNLSVDQR